MGEIVIGGDAMAQLGQHVLIVDESKARRRVIDVVMQHIGRKVTLAVNGDEAIAVLRPSLHPLIVLVDAGMRYPADGDKGSLLLTLLANQEFAATHAFVVTSASPGDDLSALQASAQTVAANADVSWLRLPTSAAEIAAAVVAAGRRLNATASGQPPTP